MNNYLSLHRTKGWMKFFTGRWSVSLATLALGLSLSLPLAASAQENLPAPTVLSPTASGIVTPKAIFTGVTVNDTQVHVYINDNLNGEANVKNGPYGTASWSYRSDTDLPLGEHIVYAVAKHKTSKIQSGKSAQLKFYVEPPFPAPTLFAPSTDNRTTYDQPWINGVAKNGSLIDIYIDGQLDGTVQVADQPSGTAGFEYQPKTKLYDGWHSINATAQDRRGKQSVWSKAVVFETRGTAENISSNAPQLRDGVSDLPTNVAAPTLLEPQSGSVITQSQPTINGLAHNDQALEIYINGQLNGEIPKQKHESGVFSFSYKPFLPLPPGVHTITAKSVDTIGMKSANSNMLSFLIRPKDIQLVVAPSGVQTTRLAQTPGTVAAVSTGKPEETMGEADKTSTPTKSEITEEAASDEKLQTEETTEVVGESEKSPELVMVEETDTTQATGDSMEESSSIDVGSEIETEEIMVTDEPKGEPEEAISVTSDEVTDETDVVVIGERSTPTADTAERSGNTILVVVLAIAAIIIIGLISWYTSREDHNHKPNESGQSDKPDIPEPAGAETADTPPTKTDDVWEEEPVESFTPEYSNESVEDEFPPPPPPPPALGI